MAKRSMTVLALVWLIVIVAAISSTLTLTLTGGGAVLDGTALSQADMELLERYSRLETIRQTMHSEYYQELDDDALMDGAARGMMDAAEDRYTFYYTPEEMAAATEEAEGVYNGIGVLVSSDEYGRLNVLRVFKGSPALEAGLLPGDIIAAVDGQEVGAANDMDMSAATKLIKSGAEGTEVLLTVLRGEEVLELPVKRAQVNMNRVETYILDGNIGYLELYDFQGDAVEGFEEALKAFEEAGVQGVIVDVRDNPGGYLNVVVDICDMILPEGLIVYTEDRYGKREEFHSDASCNDIPMVVLTNGNSASAAEIFAAAVQDYGRGVVVGETTYGKGIVQSVITFREDGAGMQLTTSAYYTPNGRSIHETGVTPDVEVQPAEGYVRANFIPDTENDAQLRAAIDALTGLIQP